MNPRAGLSGRGFMLGFILDSDSVFSIIMECDRRVTPYSNCAFSYSLRNYLNFPDAGTARL